MILSLPCRTSAQMTRRTRGRLLRNKTRGGSGRKRWTHLDQMFGEGRNRKHANCESVQVPVDGNSATDAKKLVALIERPNAGNSYYDRNYEAGGNHDEVM
jgi:hypothetical protein